MNRVSQPKQTYWAAGRHNSLKGEPGLFTFHLFLWFRRQRRFIPSYHFTYYVLISSISVYNGFQMQKVIWGDRLGGKRSLLRIQLLLLLIVSWERIGVLVWSVNQFENVRGCAGEVRIFECVCVCVHISLTALFIRDPQSDVRSTVPVTPAAAWMADLIEINKQQIHDSSVAAEFCDWWTERGSGLGVCVRGSQCVWVADGWPRWTGVSTGLLRSFSCDRPLVSSPPLPKSTHCALISHLRADGRGGERRRTGSGGGMEEGVQKR